MFFYFQFLQNTGKTIFFFVFSKKIPNIAVQLIRK